MGRLGREVVALVVFAVITCLIILVHADSWSDRAALACAFGAFTLLIALPDLRKDDDSDLALGGAIVGLEAWAWYEERSSSEPGIEQDIEEKQHRQDELLEETFFHP